MKFKREHLHEQHFHEIKNDDLKNRDPEKKARLKKSDLYFYIHINLCNVKVNYYSNVMM